MATTNPHERYYRQVKASKLAVAIQQAHAAAGVPVEATNLAGLLTPEVRRAFERAANVKSASDDTWAEVVRLLAPPSDTTDPFVGIDGAHTRPVQ